jgi:hypothetical protein
METIGWLIGSHVHCQFIIQLTHYLPLKEVLWYGAVLYPAWCIASQQRLKLVSEMALVALLAILMECPYQLVNGRPGIRLVFIEHSCQFVDLNDRFLHASSAVCYSFLLLAASSAAVIRTVAGGHTRVPFSPASILMVLPLTVPALLILFLPVHLLKVAGCSEQWHQLLRAHLPSTDSAALLKAVLNGHLACKQSSVILTVILLLTVILSIVGSIPLFISATPAVHNEKKSLIKTPKSSTEAQYKSSTESRSTDRPRSKSPSVRRRPTAAVASTQRTGSWRGLRQARNRDAAVWGRRVQASSSKSATFDNTLLVVPAACHSLFIGLMVFQEHCSDPDQLQKLLASGSRECGDVIETCFVLLVLASAHVLVLWRCRRRLSETSSKQTNGNGMARSTSDTDQRAASSE